MWQPSALGFKHELQGGRLPKQLRLAHAGRDLDCLVRGRLANCVDWTCMPDQNFIHHVGDLPP
jgi:hypothetical protein